MAAAYEDNFGYYDLEADPDEPAFFAFVKTRASRASACAALSRSSCSRGARPARDAATRWNTAPPPSETETRLPTCRRPAPSGRKGEIISAIFGGESGGHEREAKRGSRCPPVGVKLAARRIRQIASRWQSGPSAVKIFGAKKQKNGTQ
jgi:hypothetical protein